MFSRHGNPLLQIMPINSLNAYQNRWTVKARITQRSEVRRYTTARGEGKFFSVDLLDAEGGEIRAVAFNQVADQFDEVLQAGKLILLSKATLKPKKPGSVSSSAAASLRKCILCPCADVKMGTPAILVRPQ